MKSSSTPRSLLGASIVAALVVASGCAADDDYSSSDVSTHSATTSEGGEDGPPTAVTAVSSPSAAGGSEGQQTADADPVEELATLDIPTAVGYSPSEEALIKTAWSTVYSACLGDLGYDIPLQAFDAPDDDAQSDARHTLQVMLFDQPILIATYGYHWTFPGWQDPRLPAPSASSIAPQAIDSEAEDACKSKANDRLSGTRDEVWDVVLNAQRDVLSRLSLAEDRAALKESWAKCMADRGFPDQQFDDGSRIVPFLSQDVTIDEISTATADSECREASGLRDETVDQMKSSVQAWLAENEGVVQGLREKIDEQVARAKAILADEGN